MNDISGKCGSKKQFFRVCKNNSVISQKINSNEYSACYATTHPTQHPLSGNLSTVGVFTLQRNGSRANGFKH